MEIEILIHIMHIFFFLLANEPTPRVYILKFHILPEKNTMFHENEFLKYISQEYEYLHKHTLLKRDRKKKTAVCFFKKQILLSL